MYPSYMGSLFLRNSKAIRNPVVDVEPTMAQNLNDLIDVVFPALTFAENFLEAEPFL